MSNRNFFLLREKSVVSLMLLQVTSLIHVTINDGDEFALSLPRCFENDSYPLLSSERVTIFVNASWNY